MVNRFHNDLYQTRCFESMQLFTTSSDQLYLYKLIIRNTANLSFVCIFTCVVFTSILEDNELNLGKFARCFTIHGTLWFNLTN